MEEKPVLIDATDEAGGGGGLEEGVELISGFAVELDAFGGDEEAERMPLAVGEKALKEMES